MGAEGAPLIAAQAVVPVPVSSVKITPASFAVEIPVFFPRDESVPVGVRPAERVVPAEPLVFPERSGPRSQAQEEEHRCRNQRDSQAFHIPIIIPEEEKYPEKSAARLKFGRGAGGEKKARGEVDPVLRPVVFVALALKEESVVSVAAGQGQFHPLGDLNGQPPFQPLFVPEEPVVPVCPPVPVVTVILPAPGSEELPAAPQFVLPAEEDRVDREVEPPQTQTADGPPVDEALSLRGVFNYLIKWAFPL